MSATDRHCLAAVAGATVAAALAVSGPAYAAPAVDGEFSLTGQPQYLARDTAGNVWTPLAGSTANNDIAKIAPDGTVTEYDVANLADAKGIAVDASGRIWVTKAAAVARFAPSDPAGAQSFPAANVDAQAITLGSDGNLWTGGTNQAVKINPADGTATTVPVPGLSARGVAAGGDGALYFASFGDAKVYRVTTEGAVTSVSVGGGGTQEVAAGPGTQIAYTAPTANPHVVGRLGDGLVTLGESEMPTTDPFGITLGNDGAYWVARFAANDVARVTTDGQVTPLPGLAANSGPRYITRGAGDTLWVGLQTANKVARITGVQAPATPTTPTTTAPTTPAGPALAIRRLRVTPNALRRGPLLPALTRATRGSQLRFTLTRPATVRFQFARATVGRRVGGSCVQRTRQSAQRRRCVSYVPVRGSFSVRVDAAGDHRVRFQGRLDARRALRPGRYRVTARATGLDGATSAPASATFTVKAS